MPEDNGRVHDPCTCSNYKETFHSGAVYCPSWGQQSAQCASCDGCKFCRLTVEPEDVGSGGAYFWQFAPTAYLADNSAERGARLLGTAFHAIVMRCHNTAVSQGVWATDESLDEGGVCIKDKPLRLSENLFSVVQALARAFVDALSGTEEDIAEKLADAVIVIMDTAEGQGYDLTTAMMDKMEKNLHRPIRHGGERTS